jgi:hypothetical protein
MDSFYQRWHKQVDDLHYRLQDAFDDANHSISQRLKQELQDLINDVSRQRSPRDIEVRIHGIINLIEHARSGREAFLDIADAVKFHDLFEQLRRDVHAHPHYN